MANLINYHGGVQLGHITPMALFASITWADGSTANWPYDLLYLRCKVDTFFRDFLVSTYIDALSQYLVVPNPNLWPGPYAGTTGISVSASKNGTVTDGEVTAALQSEIQGGILDYTTAPIFYCVLVPPGVVVIDANGIRSDDPNFAFGGYHGVFQGANVGPVNYCVIVGVGDIDELTYRLSHETVEQITNSDWAGWYGNADSLVNELLGFPANETPEICDYTAVPEPQDAQVHGWRVATFAYEVDRTAQGFDMKIAPFSDQVPATTPDHGRIRLDTKLTRTSCLGGIIEFQQAYFEVAASHYGQDQLIGTLSWSASSDPPTSPVVEVNGNGLRTYVLVIPYGCTSVTVRCTVQTAFLGCVVSIEQTFRVITQAQSDQDANICALVKRLKEERYYDPLWWIKKFDPEFNPKAIEVGEEITRIATEEHVSHEVLAEAKRLVFKDLTSRIDAMIAAFRIDRQG